eukprot:scaffold89507_cov42-Phaeocystis_antarctica.AAC.1
MAAASPAAYHGHRTWRGGRKGTCNRVAGRPAHRARREGRAVGRGSGRPRRGAAVGRGGGEAPPVRDAHPVLLGRRGVGV